MDVLSGEFVMTAAALTARQGEGDVFQCRCVSDSNFPPEGCWPWGFAPASKHMLHPCRCQNCFNVPPQPCDLMCLLTSRADLGECCRMVDTMQLSHSLVAGLCRSVLTLHPAHTSRGASPPWRPSCGPWDAGGPSASFLPHERTPGSSS